MELKQITAAEFRAMVIAGGQRLNDQMELINSLNVFPVPDGDTGTNMNMSFTSGVENLKASNATSVGELAGALAKGLLMGARGNSGVILSQIFRGFSQSVAGKDVLDANDFVAAFAGGVESAYKAVMKPVEGTILTVARESAIRGEKKVAKTDNIIEVMQSIVTGAEKSLAKTPELLPVLKQVGVVDSGGKGLLSVYEGFLAALKGEAVIQEGAAEKTAHAHAMFEDGAENPMTLEEITFGYCTEIMVRIGEGPTTIKSFDYEAFRQTLDKKGDSLLVVADDEIVKVHIHTENPGEIMQLGQEFGELIKIKVDNMREQVRTLEANEASQQATTSEVVAPLAPAPEYAIIAVAAGDGVTELYRSMGAEVLSGGQTMNPSTEDFVKLIESSKAKRIVLLPNNKNIIMAAEQASQVAEVPTIVIPTKTIPEGIAALMAFNPEQEIEDNYTAMNAMSQQVKSGQITYSIRDTEIDGVTIKKDDFMGIVGGKIVLSIPNLADTLKQTLMVMMDEDSEIVTIIVGEEGSTEEAETVIAELAEQFEDAEFEIVQGDQPVYHYIISVE
ncbi:DAK2 domain-containing protein [Aerococcaceae bacterium zg-ZJ1578]|uniref:DAK2 domain-containing protein n=1 Tax=Aerococcaceae bacterium zg-252 TaxID=2796928 RepID=UPI001A1913B7|nr:DAK2 domain-containing protein [Aerococcaceae bacterium zg-1578]MBS4461441.1 DAK2 domain-containing protein [Aerococcaceae bacterium zg-B36]